MRRLFATVATAAFLAGTVSALAIALGVSSTLGCCLPSGKHQCSQHSNVPEFKTKSNQCPYSFEVVVSRLQGLQVANFALAAPQHAGNLGAIGISSAYRFVFRELPGR